MNVNRLCIAALTAGAIAPASAVAAPPDGQTWAELQVARTFWAERGLTGCPEATPEIGIPGIPWKERLFVLGYHDPERPCSINIAPWLARQARTGPDRRYYAAMECATVAHELAHAAGWHPPGEPDAYHSQTGLMAEKMEDNAFPYACRVFARDVTARYGSRPLRPDPFPA